MDGDRSADDRRTGDDVRRRRQPGVNLELPITSNQIRRWGSAGLRDSDEGPAQRRDAESDQFPDNLTIELTDPSTLQPLTAAPGRFTVTNTSGVPAEAVVDISVQLTTSRRARPTFANSRAALGCEPRNRFGNPA